MTAADGGLAPVHYLPWVPGSSSAAADQPTDGGQSGIDPELPSTDSAGLSPERIERISMAALARRDHSRRELERLLRSRGADEGDILSELERLEGVGLVDDAALAQRLVVSLQERKGLGRAAIAAELARRILAPSAIAYALELIDDSDEAARAMDVAQARARKLGSLDRTTAERRLSSYLARRGYSGSATRAAVEAALPRA